eukprot:767390-Hanusia_phi.AAC.2
MKRFERGTAKIKETGEGVILRNTRSCRDSVHFMSRVCVTSMGWSEVLERVVMSRGWCSSGEPSESGRTGKKNLQRGSECKGADPREEGWSKGNIEGYSL